MLKLLGKKAKSNKGFTLIELIVVIAIIAILALLLVPRFGGFTEDARMANDRNTCDILERSFMTLIANDTFRVPANTTMTITETVPGNDVWAYGSGATQLTDATPTNLAATAVEALVENLTGDVEIRATTTYTTITITIQTDGQVVATVA